MRESHSISSLGPWSGMACAAARPCLCHTASNEASADSLRRCVVQVLRCTYWLDERRTEAWLVANVGAGAGNMAGVMMGGCSATLLDQGCGLLFSSRQRGATAYLNVQYKAPVIVPGAVLVRASLDKVENRKVWITARLHCTTIDCELAMEVDSMPECATSDALFIVKRVTL